MYKVTGVERILGDDISSVAFNEVMLSKDTSENFSRVEKWERIMIPVAYGLIFIRAETEAWG